MTSTTSDSNARRFLRASLVARCAASVVFAGFLYVAAPTHQAIAGTFSRFAAVDGLLALAMGLTALAIPVLRGGFVLVGIVDGLFLIMAGWLLWGSPGIPDFGIAAVLYIGLAAIFAFLLGILKLTQARRIRLAIGRNALSAALAIAGITSVALGAAAFFMHPEPETVRWLLMTGAVVEGLALLAAAARKWPTERPTDRPPRLN